ncbi:MAG TPA: type II toxin-antitoxin system VapC family toxin [Streptosporangiaceae bacterium]|nr:type II toxin-antitoxin system VapC family toxin [Streptosporangiaceae bacterium]
MDTNVLIYAHRRDAERHQEYKVWMQAMVNGPEPYAVSDFALTGMVRVVTNPRIYPDDAATINEALAFAGQVRNQPHAHVISPGPSFWEIFARLCQQVNARAKLVPDAYLAALAMEHGCEFISTDSDFRRFPGLRWRHPLN